MGEKVAPVIPNGAQAVEPSIDFKNAPSASRETSEAFAKSP